MQLRAKIGMLATAALVAAALVYGFMPRAQPIDLGAVPPAPRTRAQAQAQVSAAQAALAVTEENARAAGAAAQLARQERVRAESLRESNFLSEQALDPARTAETRARAAEQAAAHAVRGARFELETARAAVSRAARLPAGGAGDA